MLTSGFLVCILFVLIRPSVCAEPTAILLGNKRSHATAFPNEPGPSLRVGVWRVCAYLDCTEEVESHDIYCRNHVETAESRRVPQRGPVHFDSIFAQGLDPEQKLQVLRYMMPMIRDRTRTSFNAIRTLCSAHGEAGSGNRTQLLERLENHSCGPGCVTLAEDTFAAGLYLVASNSRPMTAPDRIPLQPIYDHSGARQRQRTNRKERIADADEEDKDWWKANWPIVESDDHNLEIIREFQAQTSADAMRKLPCSFCSLNTRWSEVSLYTERELDISVLAAAVETLKTHYNIPEMESHRLFDGVYNVCVTCNRCIRRASFTSVPHLSWANGCWIGDVPAELKGLTYAEELVIARAHSTKCWFKLNSGYLSQRAAHGNVCIHPHEITKLATVLPRPISNLYEEIVVMFVRGNTPATEEVYKRTPILVRRPRILNALLWLKKHNRLYKDIIIDESSLNEYPIDGRVPYPVQEQESNSTIQGQSSTYTGHGIDETERLFATTSTEDEDGTIPISATGSFDVNQAGLSLNQRKIQALGYLKAGGSFVSSSVGDEMLSTRFNPDVFGNLWPTLFPYGVGSFEDPIRVKKDDSDGSKSVNLRRHVKHLLLLSDRRFQTHLSFPFVMHNILLIRASSYKARLAVRRRWWPAAMRALNSFNLSDVKAVEEVLKIKRSKKDFTKYSPTSSAHKAVMELIRYVDLIGEHIEGSNANVAMMREEIRAITRANGTPSLFLTLNPADTYNPLVTALAGNDIDLSATFDQPDSTYSSFDRAKILVDNPAAGAEFFNLMVHQFTNVFLGADRPGMRGVFGRLKFYYGVIEAQNRGSLHLHVLVWLEGAMSPLQIQQRCASDGVFKSRLFEWLESVFKLDLPPDTVDRDDQTKNCLMGRSPSVDDPDFDIKWPQFLRDVLDVSAQVHNHGETCYKNVNLSMSRLSEEQRDELCRFNYPQPVVPETSIDEDGKLHLKRTNPNVVGYNPTISGCFQCNTDGKFVGSGALGMALSIYITNYTAKSTLDSAVLLSAMAAAYKVLTDRANGSFGTADEERTREMLLKTLNQMIARREMSAQQVMCSLLSIKNHITNAKFATFYWTQTLQWLSTEHFPRFQPANVDTTTSTFDGSAARVLPVNEVGTEDPSVNVSDENTEQEVPTGVVNLDVDEDLALLEERESDCAGEANSTPPPLQSLVLDWLYRPLAMEDLCPWDIMCDYEKVRKKTGRLVAPVTDPNNDQPEESGRNKDLRFLPGHPQIGTHVYVKRKCSHIPVLIGHAVPRSDLVEHQEKHAIAMLALFTPWRRDTFSPLKTASVGWIDAWVDASKLLSAKHLRIVEHMQEQWQCMLAADLFSQKRKKNPHERGCLSVEDLADDIAGDIEWQLGQVADTSETDTLNGLREEEDGDLAHIETYGPSTTTAVIKTRSLAAAAGLYQERTVPVEVGSYVEGKSVEVESVSGNLDAVQLLKDIANERMLRLSQKLGRASESTFNVARADSSAVPPRLTNLDAELECLRNMLKQRGIQKVRDWDDLNEWQRVAMGVVLRFTLNAKQTLAFLLKVQDRMTTYGLSGRNAHRMIIAGPGGTGKSHVYDAIRCFYDFYGFGAELNFTAPTGVSSSNIYGSTIHYQLGLRRKTADLGRPNSKALAEIRERISSTKTLIVDEYFFLGCLDWDLISRNVNIARSCVDDPFGHLDMILSGDEFQLSSPRSVALYDHNVVSLHTAGGSVQSNSDNVKRCVNAVKNYWTINECVILDEIVRQKDLRYVQMLNRLRWGMCTVSGPDNDLDYLRSFRIGLSTVDPGLTDIRQWLNGTGLAAPLVTYTNFVRNDHNWLAAKAFSVSSGQSFDIYYAEDSVGAGRNRVVLSGTNAIDAWNTPIKSCAEDLSGRLPLIPGMPIYIVDNLAVELGLSKGSGGTLIRVKYKVENGRRYGLSAEVELPLYVSPDPDAEHPHRIWIPFLSRGIKYAMRGTSRLIGVTRRQLPLIPGFAFTSHNSQSRSLDSVIVHLESCGSTASCYVMLSRLRCGTGRPTKLAILGDVNASMISKHAPEEVRREAGRLAVIADSTLRRAELSLGWYKSLFDVSQA